MLELKQKDHQGENVFKVSFIIKSLSLSSVSFIITTIIISKINY